MNRTGSSLIRVRVRIGVASHSLTLPSLLLNASGYPRTFRERLCGRAVTLRYQHCPMPTHNKTDNGGRDYRHLSWNSKGGPDNYDVYATDVSFCHSLSAA
jgi:hypothetical protein